MPAANLRPNDEECRAGVTCGHPSDARWQYNGAWMCCACMKYFWGGKQDTAPLREIG